MLQDSLPRILSARNINHNFDAELSSTDSNEISGGSCFRVKELNSPQGAITEGTTRLSRSHATWRAYDSCRSSRSVSGTGGVSWFVTEEHFSSPVPLPVRWKGRHRFFTPPMHPNETNRQFPEGGHYRKEKPQVTISTPGRSKLSVDLEKDVRTDRVELGDAKLRKVRHEMEGVVSYSPPTHLTGCALPFGTGPESPH
ncbi:hypothetical protein BHM03_00044448 [Ensete ventricosum]|nr:hypothetical protein BHM03_00044448 [Ensete ventricosum]